MSKQGFNLNTIIQNTESIKHIAKDGLGPQDFVIVKTNNSQYTIKKMDDKYFQISGGWFDRNGMSPCKMIIRGCTWGGSVIHINMLAACGLCLEFGNNVITSPVNRIVVVRGGNLN